MFTRARFSRAYLYRMEISWKCKKKTFIKDILSEAKGCVVFPDYSQINQQSINQYWFSSCSLPLDHWLARFLALPGDMTLPPLLHHSPVLHFHHSWFELSCLIPSSSGRCGTHFDTAFHRCRGIVPAGSHSCRSCKWKLKCIQFIFLGFKTTGNGWEAITESPPDEESWGGGQRFKAWSEPNSPSLVVWLFLVQLFTALVRHSYSVKKMKCPKILYRIWLFKIPSKSEIGDMAALLLHKTTALFICYMTL